jgi:hypothetical protein
MPDSVETAPAATTTTVLDNNGNDLRQENSLSDIFSKIESGKADGKDTSDVIQEVQKTRDEELAKAEAEAAKAPAEKAPEEPAAPDEPKADEPTELEKRLAKTQEGKTEPAKEEPKKEEVSRDALRNTEPKAQEKPADAPEDAKGKIKLKDGTEVDEADLKVQPHDSPRTEKRILGLLAKIDKVSEIEATTKKELAERDAKLKELQAELEKVKTVDPKTQDDIKQQLDELKMYRRRYELDKDPDLKAKFDTRIESSEASIAKSLKDTGAGEGLLGLIKEEGGWNKFAQSNRSVTLTDGSKVTAAQLADQVLQQLPLGTRKVIESSMVEQIATAREKENYFKEQTQTAVKYFEEREQAQAKQTQQQQEYVKSVQKQIDDWVKDQEAKADWLKEDPVPADAKAEAKKELEESNEYKGKLKQLMKQALQTKDVQGALEITRDSVQMFWEKRQKEKLAVEVASLRKQLDAKQKEIDKFHSASRTTPRSGNTIASRAEGEAPVKQKFNSLEETFDAIASGRLSRSEILSSGSEE